MSDPDPKIPKPGLLQGLFNRFTSHVEQQAQQPNSFLRSFASHAATQGDQFDGSQSFARREDTPAAPPPIAPVAASSRPTMATAIHAPAPIAAPSSFVRFTNPFDDSPMEPSPHLPKAGPAQARPGAVPPRSGPDYASLFSSSGLQAVFPGHERVAAPSASSSSPPMPLRAANLDPLAAAAIMRDGYADRSQADLGGWKRLSDAELRAQGLDPKQFHDTDSGLRADLYRKDDQFVLNFRGTDKASDWLTNFGQGAGLRSAQYEGAVELTRQVHDAVPGGLHAVVGHSKGGGQAYLAAQVCQVECVVANPAWPNRMTLLQHGIHPDRLAGGPATTELVIKGEPLNSLQSLGADSLGLAALQRPHGVKIELDGPAFAPRPHPTLHHHVPGLDPDFDQAQLLMHGMDVGSHQLAQHGMASVLDATGTRRAGELAELARSGGLTRVDHIVAASGTGTGGFMVQGELGDPAALRVPFTGAVPATELAGDMAGRVNLQISVANASLAPTVPAPSEPAVNRFGGPTSSL